MDDRKKTAATKELARYATPPTGPKFKKKLSKAQRARLVKLTRDAVAEQLSQDREERYDGIAKYLNILRARHGGAK